MVRVIRCRRVAMLATVVMTASGAESAGACTMCDSATSREVRRGLIDGDVALHLLATTLPFVTVGAVAAAVHFGARLNSKGRHDGNTWR